MGRFIDSLGRCDPSGVEGVLRISGGVARGSLNPRLMAGIPPGWWMGGGVVAGVSELGDKARQRGQVKGLGSERGEGNEACGYALSGLGNVFLGG